MYVWTWLGDIGWFHQDPTVEPAQPIRVIQAFTTYGKSTPLEADTPLKLTPRLNSTHPTSNHHNFFFN
jgi:hypothetical protein